MTGPVTPETRGADAVATYGGQSPIRNSARCPECGRVFDLTDPTDADEWVHGHDCEDN